MPSGKNILLAGLGIIAVMKEEAQKQIDILIQKGGVSKGNSEKIILELITKGEAEKAGLTKIALAGKGVLKSRLQFASKEDIDRIEKKLEEISQKLK